MGLGGVGLDHMLGPREWYGKKALEIYGEMLGSCRK